MRCPSCLCERDDGTVRCPCGAALAPATDSALMVRPGMALAQGVPMTPEARMAHNLTQGFRRLVGSPQLARPLQLARTYWPVAVIPTAVAVVLGVGVKTSLYYVGHALYWGMSVAMQLLGNM
jgi:hypothetical protein